MRDKIICGFLQEGLLKFKGTRQETRKKKVDNKTISYKKEVSIKLDIADAHILQKVSKFMLNPRGNLMFNDRIFTIIKYDIIIENLPLLNLTEKGLRERFKKYVKLGVLEMTMKKHPKTGTQTYYSLSESLYNCIDGNISTQELSTGSEERLSTVSQEGLSTVSEKHYNKHYKKNNNKEGIDKNVHTNILDLFKKNNLSITDQTIKNIIKLKVSMERIEKVLYWAITNNKDIGAIYNVLKDKTPLRKTKGPTKLSRDEKIKFMKNKLDEKEIDKLRAILKEDSIRDSKGLIPMDHEIETRLGNLLMKRYPGDTKEVGRVG